MRHRPSVLELWQPEGALEALERYLADGLHEGLVADVYLGYGLAETLRREPWPSPPEPCRAAVAAARIRAADEDGVPHDRPSGSGSGSRRGRRTTTARAVCEVRAAIARGDVYQVNLVQHLSASFEGDPVGLAAALAPLRPLHPRPFVGDGWAIVSASPELFLARRGERLWTMPIKGTRPIGEDIDDAKDAAEHMMIVDLERNDLSRVCRVGSIRWPELMVQHELAGVTHLVSTVEGRVRPGAGLAEILRATFPGGSITGAPKIAAIDHIARLEPVGRGAAMGALGTIQANGDFELALTIRTFAVADGPDPPLGRRRDRVGLRARGGDRGVLGEGAAPARSRERQGRGLSLLAVAVAGRGLVDPESSRSFVPTTRRCCGEVQRSRRCALRRSAVPARPSHPAVPVLDRRARASPADGLDRTGRARHRRRTARSRAPALPHRQAARRDGGQPAGRAGGARARGLSLRSVDVGAPAPLLAGAKTTSYGEAFAAGAWPRCGRGRGAPRRGRARSGGGDGEHLVALRRRAAHAGRTARRSARRDP